MNFRTGEAQRIEEHNAAIVDQFTRQAVPFATAPAIRDAGMLDRILAIAEPVPMDTVLDVACGPGLLACAFAHVARHVTGIDITPAMLDQARKEQQQRELSNLAWDLGDAAMLPYHDDQFSIVATRFTFHHFLEPLTVLKEMRRVCRPGGKVVVVDSAPAFCKMDAFNAMEKLRDPSHTHAMSIEELRALLAAGELNESRMESCRLEGNLDDLLRRSFPNPGDEERIRTMFEGSLSNDSLDLATCMRNGTLHYGFPVAILVSLKPMN